MNGTQVIAQRGVIAQDRFVESVMEQFGFTQDEANKIWMVFRKVKAVKIDYAGGQYNLVHGAYWDKEVMQNALTEF